ncbi:hypothetical protein SUGI_0396140 [Cryptomeria japonica]|nr:hypothetical protein SUGI_0396140 [Cryptomeria japonica]
MAESRNLQQHSFALIVQGFRPSSFPEFWPQCLYAPRKSRITEFQGFALSALISLNTPGVRNSGVVYFIFSPFEFRDSGLWNSEFAMFWVFGVCIFRKFIGSKLVFFKASEFETSKITLFI